MAELPEPKTIIEIGRRTDDSADDGDEILIIVYFYLHEVPLNHL